MPVSGMPWKKKSRKYVRKQIIYQKFLQPRLATDLGVETNDQITKVRAETGDRADQRGSDFLLQNDFRPR